MTIRNGKLKKLPLFATSCCLCPQNYFRCEKTYLERPTGQMKPHFCIVAKRFQGLLQTFQLETCLLESLDSSLVHHFHQLLELWLRWSAFHQMGLADSSLTEQTKKLTAAKIDIRQTHRPGQKMTS